MLYGVKIQIPCRPVLPDDRRSLKVLIGYPGSVRCGIVVHSNEIWAYCTSVWTDVHVQDLIDVSLSRQSAIFDDMQVSLNLHAYPCPNHY